MLVVLLPVYTLLVAQIGFVLCMIVLGSANDPFEVFRSDMFFMPYTRPEGRTNVLVPAAVLSITQLVFLLPILRPKLAALDRGRSLLMSVVCAGFCSALLTTGLFFISIEVVGLLIDNNDLVGEVVDPVEGVFESWTFWPFVLASWILWAPLLFVFVSHRRGPRVLSRLVLWLLAGTIVELLVIVPVDIMVRRRTNCYCATGTAFALCMSICALLWLTGPGIVLALTSKRRRLWWDTHCMNCGYQKGPSPGDKCPECGFDWRTITSR